MSGRAEETPVSVAEQEPLLVTTIAQQSVVKRFGPCARRAGVREHMPLPLARALFPSALVQPFDLASDCRQLFQLARWALRFTPRVAIDPELLAAMRSSTSIVPPVSAFGLLLDLTGTERLHHGEERLLEKIQAAFRRARFDARFAIAPTIGAAWALSRMAKDPQIVPSTSLLREALAALPVYCLRLPETTREALRDIGITSIGALGSLPRRSLASRFGVTVTTRLDQLFGAVDEPLATIKEPEQFVVQRKFEIPLQRHESLFRALHILFTRLWNRLAQRHLAATSFLIILEGERVDRSRTSMQREVALNSTTSSHTHLLSVLTPFIESIRIQEGIDTIILKACRCGEARDQQLSSCDLGGERISEDEFSHLLNQLVTRVGEARVQHAVFHESHLPEHSITHQPIEPHYSQRARKGGAPTDHVKSDRPAVLFSTPENISVIALLPDTPPASIRWRRETFRIVKSIGPERIEKRWWKDALSREPHGRDYFKVQRSDGQWLWVFREIESHTWYIHGMWV